MGFWVLFTASAMVLSVLGYGYQAWTIRKRKSGQGISIAWLTGNIAGSIAAILYGISKHDPIFWFNGIVNLLCQALVLYKVWKRRGLSTRDKKMELVLLAVIVIEPFLPAKYLQLPLFHLAVGYKDFALLAVGFVAWLAQRKELQCSDRTSVFRTFMPITQMVASVIFAAYTFHKGHSGPLVGFTCHVIGQALLIRQNTIAQNR